MTEGAGGVPTAAMAPAAMAQFITAQTRLLTGGLVPEVRLYLADEPLRLWEMTERASGCTGLPPPFWAFAWAGGQALARYVLDHPDIVRGRRVLDVATGCGIVAIAAAMAGAAEVTGTDIDPFAIAAVALNARANAAAVTGSGADVLDGDGARVDGGCVGRDAQVVLAADVFYEQELAGRVVRYLRRVRAAGAAVFVGDLGRRYLPRSGFTELTAYDVAVPRALEDADVKRTAVWVPAW